MSYRSIATFFLLTFLSPLLPADLSAARLSGCGFLEQPFVAGSRATLATAVEWGLLRKLSEQSVPVVNRAMVAPQVIDKQSLLESGFRWKVTSVVDLQQSSVSRVPEVRAEVVVYFKSLGEGELLAYDRTYYRNSWHLIQPAKSAIEIALEMVDQLEMPAMETQQEICHYRSLRKDLARDTDGDGIIDTEDQCPNQPEDRNGYKDHDGCPENLPLLAITVEDDRGSGLDSLLTVYGEDLVVRSRTGSFLLPLKAGAHRMRFFSKSYKSRMLRVQTPSQPLTVRLSKADTKAEIKPIVGKQERKVKGQPQQNVKQELRRAVEAACGNAEDRNCLDSLDRYLNEFDDPSMRNRRQSIATEMNNEIEQLYDLGLQAFREENIRDALEYWGEASLLDPSNLKIQESLKKARKLESVFR